eukprot:g12649.t1
MAQESVRVQVESHWRAFDALADTQSGANEAIIRALDVFEGARGSFTAAQEPASNPAAASGSAANVLFGGLQDPQWASPMGVPRGNANAGGGDDAARRAYFRAEEALMLARQQLTRSEETLQEMGEVVDRAKSCIGSRYNTDEVASRQERKDVRARASAQALGRGGSGCAMSPVEMARAMAGLLRMHQSELEMQETIVYGLGYDTPRETVTAYREALGLRPFMDDGFRSEVEEVRELSQELENPRTRV